jgi:hypothetical protein
MNTEIFVRRAALIAGVALFVGAAGGCGKEPAKPASPPKPAAKTEWSQDEMASDPEGYLRWALTRLEDQKKVREERLAKIDAQRKEIVGKRASYAAKVDDCDNIVKRMRVAIRRAEDEDRWPVSLGGRNFERGKADQVIQACEKLMTDERPRVQIYDDALAKLDAASATFRSDLNKLADVRAKVELDLERVRLSQGVAELAQLKKTEAEIAHYAKILGSVADDVSAASRVQEPSAPDLDSLLK